MPPLPAALGVVKLEVMGDIAGNTYFANIFHLGGGEDPWSLSDLEALEGALEASLESLYTGNMGAAVSVTTLKLTDLSSDTGAVYEKSVSWTGGRIGISAQASACVMATYAITRRYRGGHPRTYFPFGDAALQLDPQSWDETFVANVAANLATFNDVVNGYSPASQLGCVSYYSGGVVRATPIFEVFTSSAVEVGIRSQRRRLTSTTF